MAFDERLRSPKEGPLYKFGAVISFVTWGAMVISIVGIFAGLAAMAMTLLGQAMFLAHVKGDGVRVTSKQFPDLHALCESAARRLGLTEVPEVYIMQSGGVLNAFASNLFSRRFIVIYSSLVEACRDPRELEFVIGHEFGHLAAGHLTRNLLLLPMRVLPWIGPAYSRACEYTADRAGFAAAQSPVASMRGLAVLAAGGKMASEISLDEFIRQCQEAGTFWMAIRELVSSHPYLCKRAAAIHELAAPGTAPPVARHVLAYPFAPLLGLPAGGLSSIALIGVLYTGMAVSMARTMTQGALEQTHQHATAVDEELPVEQTYDVASLSNTGSRSTKTPAPARRTE